MPILQRPLPDRTTYRKAELSTMTQTLTRERLRELLDYDAKTGIFRWRVKHLVRHGNTAPVSGRLADLALTRPSAV